MVPPIQLKGRHDSPISHGRVPPRGVGHDRCAPPTVRVTIAWRGSQGTSAALETDGRRIEVAADPHQPPQGGGGRIARGRTAAIFPGLFFSH